MDKLLEDDNFSGSDLDDDPDNMEVPGCGVSLLPPVATNNNPSDSITPYLNFTNGSISQFPSTESLQSSHIKPTNQSTTNIKIAQTQLMSNPTKISTPTAMKISVNVNGKVLKLNTEKAVVVTPSLLKSLGGLPNTNNATAAMKNLKFVNNNSSPVNNNLTSVARPQIQIAGQKNIVPSAKQGIPIHPSGKITKTNLKNTVRLDATSLQSMGLKTQGIQPQRFKILNNGSAKRSILQTSTPVQLNGGIHFEMGPDNELVRVTNPVQTRTPQVRTVGNVRNPQNVTFQQPLLNGAIPKKIVTQPNRLVTPTNRFVTTQNGVGTGQVRVGTVPNRFGTIQNGVGTAQVRVGTVPNRFGTTPKVGTMTNRVGQMPPVSSSTNANGVRFQIGPNNQLLKVVNPPKASFPQVLGKGRVLTVPNGKTSVNNGRGLLNGHNTPKTPQQFISKVVNSINSGNLENLDRAGIAQFMEQHMQPNNGKRKFQMGPEHDYNSFHHKRGSVMEEEVENEEELGVAETYASYMPSKLKIGRKHPDPVVETASLSSVAPVDVWYELSIPSHTIDSGALSALQLESITYASQAHEQFLPDGTRAGFLLGDGAGVGKGRTIAGIILENFLKGRERAVWVSISNDLKYDAERDLADIGAPSIPVYQLNKMKYNAKISSEVNGSIKRGVLFCSYSSLIGESNNSQGKYTNRRHQILQWCGSDFDGVLIFDECHKAKNLCTNGSVKPTKTGKMVVDLQEKLPKARVLYASATGASEPKNMAYMVRLGLWGPGTTFDSFDDFTSAVEERGVGGMEIVAMDMKLRGMYIARQLSFQDVKFQIKEVKLSDEFKKLYNMSVKLWVDAFNKFNKAAKLVAANNNMRKSMWGQFWSGHQRFYKYLIMASKVNAAVELTHKARKDNKCVVIGLQSTGEARTLDQLEKNDGELNDFVSTAMGVFQNLIEKHFPSSNRDNVNKILSNISANKQSQPKNDAPKKVDERTLMRRKQIALLTSDLGSDSEGSITFDSDEEEEMSDDEKMRIKKQREAEEDVEKTNNYLNMIFGGNEKKKNNLFKGTKGKEEEKPALPTTSDIEQANKMKEELLEKINKLGKKLPKNTLDELIDNLGGPDEVAEMTGRKGRVVQTDNGIQYESRSEQDVPLETLNVKEKQRFMDGEKLVAIISEAASSGISLQSDRRAKNQRKRVHITLELPWSADKAVQQFGRTHRSNQVSAPEYIFLVTDLAGERRFSSIVAKRLESLGALTHGDRRASENRDLSQFNIDNKYGKAALEQVMKAVVGKQPPLIPAPKDYKGLFFKDVTTALMGVGLIEEKDGSLVLDKEYNQIPKFLNRLLGVPVDLQNTLFEYFSDTMAEIINIAKRDGTFDLGILDLGKGEDEHIKRVKTTTFKYRHATGIAPIELHKLKVEKGMSWNHAMNVFREEVDDDNGGFYESHHSSQSSKRYVILLTKMRTIQRMYDFKKEETKYIMYRPNTGRQNKRYTIEEIEEKYRKAKVMDVKNLWIEQYNSTVCTHVYSSGRCRKGGECSVGLRVRIYHVLAGSVLPVWQKIEAAISQQSSVHKKKMQVLRLKTTEDRKIVGTQIINHMVEGLIRVLQGVAESVEEEEFPEESN